MPKDDGETRFWVERPAFWVETLCFWSKGQSVGYFGGVDGRNTKAPWPQRGPKEASKSPPKVLQGLRGLLHRGSYESLGFRQPALEGSFAHRLQCSSFLGSILESLAENRSEPKRNYISALGCSQEVCFGPLVRECSLPSPAFIHTKAAISLGILLFIYIYTYVYIYYTMTIRNFQKQSVYGRSGGLQ